MTLVPNLMIVIFGRYGRLIENLENICQRRNRD